MISIAFVESCTQTVTIKLSLVQVTGKYRPENHFNVKPGGFLAIRDTRARTNLASLVTCSGPLLGTTQYSNLPRNNFISLGEDIQLTCFSPLYFVTFLLLFKCFNSGYQTIELYIYLGINPALSVTSQFGGKFVKCLSFSFESD